MGIFNRKKEERATLEEVLLSAALVTDTITVENALSIPTVAACVALISNTVAMIPINLYQEKDGETKPILDNRVKLLNDDTRDTLDGFQFKKAIVKDYLLRGAGYAYIKKEKNKVKSIHYVKRSSISINANVDPVFKDYDILVNGKSYRPFEFIKVLRDSENGSNGKSVIDESCKAFLVAYNTLAYENILVKQVEIRRVS